VKNEPYICEKLYNRTYLIKAVLSCFQTIAQVHERLPITPKTAYPAPGLLVESSSGCAGIHWIGCLARLSYPYRTVWSAAAWLPQQPCSRSGSWHAVDTDNHADAGCARHDHRVRSGMNEITSSRRFWNRL